MGMQGDAKDFKAADRRVDDEKQALHNILGQQHIQRE